jgi:molecular chaperone Hsp33
VNAGNAAADTLSRFVFEHAPIRGAYVALDAACRDILACHAYPPALQRVLGELLAATALLASTLKFAGTLTVQLQGDGAVRLLVVECDARLTLRATAQWGDDAEALPADASLCALAGGPERGRLAITLDPRDGGPFYQGIVALESGSVATLIEHYLATSEQIASRLLLAAANGRSRGLLLQRLPGARSPEAGDWAAVEARLDALPARVLHDATAAAPLLQALFPDDDLRLFAGQPTRFACRCSAERVANALRLIGRPEVERLVGEDGAVAVHCEFCNRRYAFDAAAACALFEPATGGGTPPVTH